MVLVKGSPPHTRDKCIAVCRRALETGIIPAYAGQIYRRKYEVSLFRDHPRIRGTNFLFYNFHPIRPGSSPHTRDKYSKGKICRDYGGIIPAYAGQIQILTFLPPVLWDHPRIRGTNSDFGLKLPDIKGSSPHTRDKYGINLQYGGRHRIIPAYAGQMGQSR